MIHIDALKILKYDTNEEMYVFLAKEGNIFYVWTSEEEWEHQDFNDVKLKSNQSKNLQTAVEIFNFYKDSFESVEDVQDEEDSEM